MQLKLKSKLGNVFAPQAPAVVEPPTVIPFEDLPKIGWFEAADAVLDVDNRISSIPNKVTTNSGFYLMQGEPLNRPVIFYDASKSKNSIKFSNGIAQAYLQHSDNNILRNSDGVSIFMVFRSANGSNSPILNFTQGLGHATKYRIQLYEKTGLFYNISGNPVDGTDDYPSRSADYYYGGATYTIVRIDAHFIEGYIKLYLNGTLAGTTTFTPSKTSDTESASSILQGSTALNLHYEYIILPYSNTNNYNVVTDYLKTKYSITW